MLDTTISGNTYPLVRERISYISSNGIQALMYHCTGLRPMKIALSSVRSRATGVFFKSIQNAPVNHAPSFSPSLLIVTNFAHNFAGEDEISDRDGCLHVVVAFLSALPKIAETILMFKENLSR